jgi:hypothetical protein
MAGVTRAVPTGVELAAVVLRAFAATLSVAVAVAFPALASEPAATPSLEEAGPEVRLAVGCPRPVALDPVVLPSRTAPELVGADARASEARSGVAICAP